VRFEFWCSKQGGYHLHGGGEDKVFRQILDPRWYVYECFVSGVLLRNPEHYIWKHFSTHVSM
jgi:hypothetical protein